MAKRASITRTVCLTELRLLLRDRRAFMLAIVVPMLLFPFLFFGMDALKRGSEESQQLGQLKVALDLDLLRSSSYDAVKSELGRADLRLTLSSAGQTELGRTEPWSSKRQDGRPDPELWRPEAEGLMEEVNLLVVARNELRVEQDAETRFTGLKLVYDGSDNQSIEALRRVSGALDALRERSMLRDTVEELGLDPGAMLTPDPVDLASAENAAGHKLGGLLPIILVLIVISSASFAALGAFAGEREEGTIETLLVQPVNATAVARGKFLAVLIVACAAALGNGLSFLVSILMGLGQTGEQASELAIGPQVLRVGLGMLHFLPTAIFLSAFLTLVSARARSFREGQHYVLPIVLVASLLASVSTQDSIPAGLLFALVPISGPTLVLRDTLAGSFPLLPALVSFVASSAWSWLLLQRLAETLDAERLFKSPETSAEAAMRHADSQRALRFGLLAVALVYIVGGRLQTAALIPGLMLTLWVLLPLLAIACAQGTRKRSGESLREALGLVAVAPSHLLGALLLSPLLMLLMGALFAWQSKIMPLPSGLEVPEELLALPAWLLVFVAAISPGINEELLFRGAIQGGLKRDLSPAKVVAWQALLFGAVHASIYRFVATGLIGATLALLTLRTRCLWPAMLAHAAYNAINLLELPSLSWWSPQLALGLGVLGVGLIWGTPAARGEPGKRSDATPKA